MTRQRGLLSPGAGAERVAVRAGETVHPKSRSDEEGFAWGLARFLEEARTLARFRHPNLHDYFQVNHTAYIVMDNEEGESLERVLERRGTLSGAQLKRVLLPIVDGLKEVHAAGYLHHDIKPSNLFIRRVNGTRKCLTSWGDGVGSGGGRV